MIRAFRRWVASWQFALIARDRCLCTFGFGGLCRWIEDWTDQYPAR